MKDEFRNNTNENNEKKILLAFDSKLKLHLILQDSSWRNGYVHEVRTDFFIFDDVVNGLEPIWFLEVADVKPYMEPEEQGEGA